MSLKDTYNRIAEDWHRDHQSDTWWIEATDIFASKFSAGAAILDVGCGAGTKSKYLAGKGLRVTGIDFSEKMIAIAKREVPEATFHVLDLADVHTLPETYDGIFLQAVLLHVPKDEAEKKVHSILSRLKSGGYLYIGVKAKKPDGPDVEIKREDDYGYTYERFFSYYTQEEMRTLFTNLDLEIVYDHITPPGKTRWIQLIGKKQ